MKIEATPRNRAGELALEIYRRTLEQVRGDRLVREHVQLNGRHLLIDDLSYHLSDFDRIVVAGAGKASVAMAQGLEQVLGSLIHDGLIITKHGHSEPLQFCQVMEASHPVPGEDSLAAGQEMLKFADRYSGERNLVLFVLSGGASALMEAPVDGISLDDLQAVNRKLLASGATILTFNAIRSPLSQIKAGGLVKAFGDATVVVLVMSDVEGDRLNVIGSGPFVVGSAEPETESLMRAFELDSLPAQVQVRLKEPQVQIGSRQPEHRIIGNARLMGECAVEVAKDLGLRCEGSLPMEGEARDYPGFLAAKKLFPSERADCVIAVGEPIATVKGAGLGGRAQEMACVFAEMIQGQDETAVLVAGSDGTDGPTDAAGALVDGNTVQRAMDLGDSVAETLERSDSYRFHEAAGTLIKSGPTGTNLNDLMIYVRAGEP